MTKLVQASIGLFLGWILATIIFWAVGYGAVYGAEYKFKTIQMPEARHTLSYGISDLGDVVGISADCDTCQLDAFLFTDGNYYELGIAGVRFMPFGINRAGLIAGTIIGPQGQRAVIMDEAQTTVLDLAIRADSINNHGAVVGYRTNAPFDQAAYKWKAGVYSDLVTSAQVPGILASAATGINNHGDTVGYYFYQKPDFSFVTQGFIRKAGQIGLVDILPLGINNDGLIVGLSGIGNDGAILENGIVQLIKVPGADYTQVHGINNRGHLVGYYQKAGQIFGFVAKPVQPNK